MFFLSRERENESERERERERDHVRLCVCVLSFCVCAYFLVREKKTERDRERRERGGILFHFKTSSFSSQDFLEETRREKKGPTRVTNLSVDLLSLSSAKVARTKKVNERKNGKSTATETTNDPSRANARGKTEPNPGGVLRR